MSHSLLERLRAALARQYDVERELGAGGMGTVFLARDLTLQRRVAIKILRPELATATAAERFLREARILASISHPNVVPVHSAGDSDGIFYYVMDYVDGETLERRLARGRLSQDEAVKLGGDLLSALQAAHERGVIHRDVKPSNIFLVGDRALLGDFGVSKPTSEDSPGLTDAGHRVGTPAYMAPEQVEGDATRRSDLYSAGMLLYEALTGERWSIATPTDRADWSGVPAPLVPVLRRALALSPADRWSDVAAFRDALLHPRSGRGSEIRKYALAAIVPLGVAVWLAYLALRPEPGIGDLAILPVEVMPEDTHDGRALARLVSNKLESVRQVRLISTRVSFPWWDAALAERRESPIQVAAQERGARYVARATLVGRGDAVDVQLAVFDATGSAVPGPGRLSFDRYDLQEVSDSLAVRLLRIMLEEELPEVGRLTGDVDALTSFLNGEDAFERGAWGPAVDYYEAAVARDSTFVLAWWRLANAWRWLGQPGPYDRDFQQILDRYGAALGPLDSLLMAAQLAPAGEQRFEMYRRAHERYPRNDFAAYLYGEELFNRGPLWGRSLEEAASVLEEAVTANPYWASSFVHLIWANIRLGRSDEARRALGSLPAIAADPHEGWRYPPELLEQAIYERFEQAAAAERRGSLLAHPEFGTPDWLIVLARLGGAFDVPETELVLGALLAADATLLDQLRAGGHEAQGLGAFALGRMSQALAHFDSAAALFASPEAMLQAAEWRVAARVTWGPQAIDEAEAERARRRLEGMVDGPLGERAAWALAMDVFADGDTLRSRRWSTRLPAGQLASFMRAMREAAHGRYEEALEASEPLLASQPTGVPLRGGASPALADPFLRSLLHLKRGAWYEELGDLREAEREYLWYEAVDIAGFPSQEPAQAGEIDWAFATYGRYLRGMAAIRAGEIERACAHLERVVELWSEADAALAVLRAAARGAMSVCGVEG